MTDCVGRSADITGGAGSVTGSTFQNSTGSGIDGFVMVGADNWSIVGNRITDHAVHGIELTSSSFNVISGNYIWSNGDENTNGHGIDINGTGCDENVITGNIIGQNDGVGINIDTGATDTIIIGNSIQNNEDGQIADSGTNTLYQTATDGDPLNIV